MSFAHSQGNLPLLGSAKSYGLLDGSAGEYAFASTGLYVVLLNV